MSKVMSIQSRVRSLMPCSVDKNLINPCHAMMVKHSVRAMYGSLSKQDKKGAICPMKRNLPRSQHIETLENFTVAFLPLVVASNECHECLKHVVNNEEKDPNL